MAERNSLLTSRGPKSPPRVRIPPSPYVLPMFSYQLLLMAEVIDPGQYRKVRELEIGEDWLPEEIWGEDDDIEEIRDIIWIKREKNYLAGGTEPNNRQQLTIQKTEFFCKDVTDSYNSFLELITHTPIASLSQEQIMQPYFYIALNSEREKILRKLEMDQPLKKNSLILIFKLPSFLPSPLSEEELSLLQGLTNNRKECWEEWDFIYKTLRGNLWNILHKHEEKQNLRFRRINNVKEHDPKNYYYIWEVNLGNRRKKKLPHS